jgi:hypothetical protein
MVRKPAARTKKANPNAPLGLEAQLWAAADALRNNMDAAGKAKDSLGRVLWRCWRLGGATLPSRDWLCIGSKARRVPIKVILHFCFW